LPAQEFQLTPVLKFSTQHLFRHARQFVLPMATRAAVFVWATSPAGLIHASEARTILVCASSIHTG
jgi:hypothetical protein